MKGCEIETSDWENHATLHEAESIIAFSTVQCQGNEQYFYAVPQRDLKASLFLLHIKVIEHKKYDNIYMSVHIAE